jgi:16S rRNA (cytosine967-C5)-methyltransferase
VQDETAQRVAAFVQPRPGERVVDLCAAPGGKVSHLAELMQDQGRVDALDIDDDRLVKVRDVVKRFDLKTVVVGRSDAPLEGAPPIDRVLVDAPCSNTGVLRRRVEARWRVADVDWDELARVQTQLLDRALELVRPGGVVVYSTCSIEATENEDRVQALLARRPEVKLDAQESILPQRGGGDGGYMARLVKTA